MTYHEKLFGCRPRGMWPSEGSVRSGGTSEIAEAGIQWIATDEEILSCSTNGWVSRDGNGFLRNPEMLYRPWRVENAGHQLQIIFRDHAMSDQIGFHYQRQSAESAVSDFLGKLDAIGNATRANAGHRPTLVSIILDGENCWEYYPNGGVDFLRRLYRELVSHRKVTPTRVCDYLERYPATDKLGHLFPGSWNQPQFWHLDRPSRVQSGLGPARRDATLPRSCDSEGEPRRPISSTLRGANFRSPREATGSGGLVTITRAIKTACSTDCSANTFRMSIRRSTRRLRSNCHVPSAITRQDAIKSRPGCCASKSTGGTPTLNGSTPGISFAMGGRGAMSMATED